MKSQPLLFSVVFAGRYMLAQFELNESISLMNRFATICTSTNHCVLQVSILANAVGTKWKQVVPVVMYDRRNHLQLSRDRTLKFQIPVWDVQIVPHVVKPITSKKWFRISLAIVHPEPRASKRTKIFNGMLGHVIQGLLDLGYLCSVQDLLRLLFVEHF